LDVPVSSRTCVNVVPAREELLPVVPYGITLKMVDRKRERVLNVRLLDVESQMLAQLADREGVSVSEWIRNIIRAEHAAAFGRPKPKTKTRK